MVRLYREFGNYKVDALVPWAFLESQREHQPDVVEKFNVEAHLLRIMASDMAYVVNPDGHVGPNSTIDIGAALEAGKDVYSMERIADRGIAVMMSGIKTPAQIVSMAQQIKR